MSEKEFTNYEKYEIVKERQAIYDAQEKQIKALILADMKSHDLKKSSGAKGKFSYSLRKTKSPFGEEIEVAKDKLKLAKEKAIEKGQFTVSESEILTYKIN
jgi:hypothetical protein